MLVRLAALPLLLATLHPVAAQHRQLTHLSCAPAHAHHLFLAITDGAAGPSVSNTHTHECAPSLRPCLRRVGQSANTLTANQLLGLECIRPDQVFVELSFERAQLVQSNLGGQGGRCVDSAYCNVAGVELAACPAADVVNVRGDEACSFYQPPLSVHQGSHT